VLARTSVGHGNESKERREERESRERKTYEQLDRRYTLEVVKVELADEASNVRVSEWEDEGD
jgi:hypothetical protein